MWGFGSSNQTPKADEVLVMVTTKIKSQFFSHLSFLREEHKKDWVLGERERRRRRRRGVPSDPVDALCFVCLPTPKRHIGGFTSRM
jgi:hypothetical protein